MTRDRVDLLQKALLSVLEQQLTAPPVVIVSNNSTREHPEIADLQRRYRFTHVRQSGTLTVTEHHNACLRLATTTWVWLLHDDDELSPGAISGITAFLNESDEVGIVIGGVNDMTYDGDVIRHWIPTATGVHRGDAALLELGMNWGVRAPAQIFRTQASREIGGFHDMAGYSADVAFACTLAYRYGVKFYPKVIGRFRMGAHQTSHVQTEDQIRRWMSFHGMQVDLIRSLGSSPQVSSRIADDMMWRIMLPFLDDIESKPMLMYQLKKMRAKHAPHPGEWRQRVQDRCPCLFWGPGWIAWPSYRLLRKTRYWWSLLGFSKMQTW